MAERAKNVPLESLLPVAEDEIPKAPAPQPELAAAPGELTPEQKEIQDLKDQLAKEKARVLTEAPDEFEEAVAPDERAEAIDRGDLVILHFLEDGFTAAGHVWYRGQEIEFVRGSAAYAATQDRKGNSWTDLDETGQINRYGRIFFRKGPWPFAPWQDERAAVAEKRRGRAVPRTPVG